MRRGFSLIEVIIVSAVMLLFFGGLFLTLQNSLKLITDSRSRLSALSVANTYMEYIRSFSYDNLGTTSGFPSGIIPQVSTTSLNGIVFTRTTLVEYVDDPADGVGTTTDSNGITTDYKRAKIEVSWMTQAGATSTVYLITNFAPPSIETNVGGGTIRVNVFDALVAPLPGATVRVFNTSGTSTYDVTKTADATGVALFVVAAGSGYQIIVNGTGYSTDQTYVATTTNPNPSKLPVSVAAAGITTSNFFIDRLGTLSLRALTNQATNRVVIGFATSTEVATGTNTVVISDELRLVNTSGTYATSGEAYVPLTPTSTLISWQSIKVVSTLPAGTSYRLRVYTGTTTPVIVPDSDLPGNSTGFTGSFSLTGLSTTTYPSITVRTSLTTTAATATPTLLSLEARYVTSETPFVGNYNLKGAKTIGTNTDTTPVYKYSLTKTTDGRGNSYVSNIEWDSYTPRFTNYDVAEACTDYPVAIAPGATTSVALLLTLDTSHTLRVTVRTSSGVPVEDATVTLTNGSSDVATTSSCGQVFFKGLVQDSDYRLTVSAPGYTTTVVDPLDISGDKIQLITL